MECSHRIQSPAKQEKGFFASLEITVGEKPVNQPLCELRQGGCSLFPYCDRLDSCYPQCGVYAKH